MAGALSTSMLSVAGWTRAQAAPDVPSDLSEQTDVDPTIVLMFEPSRPDSNRLIQAIQSHLVGLPVRVVLEPLPRGEILKWFESGHVRAKERRALGLFAIDTGHRDLWRLYFLDVDGAPTLIRRLRPSPQHAPLDDAGVAVRLLVEALLDVRPPGLAEPALGEAPPPVSGSPTRPPPGPGGRSSARKQLDPRSSKAASPRPSRSPPPSEVSTTAARDTNLGPARRPGALAIFAGAVSTPWLADQAWQFGARGGAEVHLNDAWSVALDYTWYPTVSLTLAETTIDWARHPVATQVAYRPNSGFSPRFWLGVWGDPVTRTTLVTGAAYRRTGAKTTWSWGPAGGIGFGTPSLWSFSALLDLGVEVAAARVEYAVSSDASQTPLATTRTIRPSLSLRLGWRP